MQTNEIWGQRSVVSVLQADHAYIRYVLNLVKDESYPLTTRKKIFIVLAAAVKSHFQAQQEAVFGRLSAGDPESIRAAFECEEEQRLIELLMEKMSDEHGGVSNDGRWAAQLNIFSDMLGAHLKHEENLIYPMIMRKFEHERQRAMIDHYTRETRRASELSLRIYRLVGLGEISSELPSAERSLEQYRPAGTTGTREKPASLWL